MQNTEITEKNIVNKLSSEVKRYDYEPMYFLSYEQNICYSEILLNDIPINENFKELVDGGTFEINNCIFKSGIQKITLRMHPAGKHGLRDLQALAWDTNMKIDITVADNRKQDLKGKEVLTYVTPLSTYEVDGYKKTRFIATGKDYYEASFTFNATIPYEVEGFENARDLRDWDKKILEKKLLYEYSKVKNIYQNKEYDNIARTSYDGLRNQFVAEYQNREYINDVWTMLMEVYKQPTFEMQPIEDYKLVFFAEGRLVALMQNSKDPRVRGNTALWAKFNRGEGIETLFCNSYFYIPKGETEFKIY
ncbi:hypothetical protein [Flavobacterium ginsengiterrae]|uniref:Uncharacterized protein n=1 Tax=Flavobacterium ginsengiterrae TaxID=871695 RepID=A0ABP7GGD7_9FLAO